jgi:hypothetical protein
MSKLLDKEQTIICLQQSWTRDKKVQIQGTLI